VRKILLAGILTNVCVLATAVQACDRFFRVCLVEDAAGAFRDDWHESAVQLLSGPQCAPGHAGNAVGLYFGEVATLSSVEAALSQL
jgi:nicotinamidase-related amidase